MMIVVANLRLSGFFRLVSAWVGDARPPPAGAPGRHRAGLGRPLGLSRQRHDLPGADAAGPRARHARSSATRCPICWRSPWPRTSAARPTITGNPQNMMIGSFSRIPYGTSPRRSRRWPAIGLLLTVLLIALVYRAEFWTGERLAAEAAARRGSTRRSCIKSAAVTLAMMALFFAGQPVAKVAIVARRAPAAHPPRQAREGLSRDRLAAAGDVRRPLHRRRRASRRRCCRRTRPGGGRPPAPRARAGLLSAVTAVLSNLVSNVPAVLVLKPFVAEPAPTRSAPGWWSRWPRRWPATSRSSARSPT